jgi:hypothetical protein
VKDAIKITTYNPSVRDRIITNIEMIPQVPPGISIVRGIDPRGDTSDIRKLTPDNNHLGHNID